MYEYGRNLVALRKIVKRSCLIIETENITTIEVLDILVQELLVLCRCAWSHIIHHDWNG